LNLSPVHPGGADIESGNAPHAAALLSTPTSIVVNLIGLTRERSKDVDWSVSGMIIPP
jgi:hypothetical protein